MPNRLADSSSPHLRKHADNLIDWQPWDAQALAYARAKDRPILLSVGYTASHSCHVMAHTSFVDEETAEVMNRLFVNIKVDREERPDIDRIYMTAMLMLMHTGSGIRHGAGWPLTMFLSPRDQVPYFGGTHFPHEGHPGYPAFINVCESAAAYYDENKERLARTRSFTVRDALVKLFTQHEDTEWPENMDAETTAWFAQRSDKHYGGLAGTPKFPRATHLRWLMHEGGAHGRQMALEMLQHMAEGGLHDHVGGGFFRYSHDAQWMTPCFEKMLYDQALLLPLYAEATLHAQHQAQVIMRDAAYGIVRYLRDAMQCADGGFYSSLDAVQDGVEGGFYVWEPAEVEALIGPERYHVFAFRYGLGRPANFHGRHHLHAYRSIGEVTAYSRRNAEAVSTQIRESCELLFAARAKRTHPGLDDKILTSWNGMTITGLCRAADIFNEPDWRTDAARALTRLRENMWVDGRMLASFSQGAAMLNGYLDDYAFPLEAALAVLEAQWDPEVADFALALGDAIAAKFLDKTGDLFYTSHDHEKLITRLRLIQDDVTPTGAAVAMECFARGGFLFGRTDWVATAERVLARARSDAASEPAEHLRACQARNVIEDPAPQVVLRGGASDIAAWRTALGGRAECYAVADDAQRLPESIASKPATDGPVAYICTGLTCAEPIRDFDTFIRTLTS